jgi:hypothetical protein
MASLSGLTTKVTVSLRTPRGKFPSGSYARVLGEIRPLLVQDIEGGFDASRDPETKTPWASRKIQPGRQAPNHPLLVKTGTLRQEAVSAARSAVVNGSTLTMRTNKPSYGGYHQKGTRFMVARRWAGVSRATRMRLAKLLVKEGIRVFRGRAVS